jgi:penicillin-binding protein 2
MGVDLMHDFMKPLGFGQITGIDLKGEVRGVLPSQEWKRNDLQAPRGPKVVRRRDHFAGHRTGLQQLHHAATGTGHGHRGRRRSQAQAAPGAGHRDTVTGKRTPHRAAASR